MDSQEILKAQLEHLLAEHQELDNMIENMMNESIVNQIGVQRLKKRKLLLKDQIAQARSQLLPNIIA